MTEQLVLKLDGTADSDPSKSLTLRFEAGTLVVDGLAREDVSANDYPKGHPLRKHLVWDDRIDRFRAPAIEYRLVLAAMLREGFTVYDEARGYREVALEIAARFEPHEHQQDAFDAWVQGNKRGVVVLPTGSGKTCVAQMAIEAVGRSALVLVPTLDLMNQWSGVLAKNFGCP